MKIFVTAFLLVQVLKERYFFNRWFFHLIRHLKGSGNVIDMVQIILALVLGSRQQEACANLPKIFRLLFKRLARIDQDYFVFSAKGLRESLKEMTQKRT